jgi:hypothetical protein
MSEARDRAEARRRTWKGGVAAGHAELERISVDFWLAQSGEQRIGAVFDLWDEQTSNPATAVRLPVLAYARQS